jgi:hypothetical protein
MTVFVKFPGLFVCVCFFLIDHYLFVPFLLTIGLSDLPRFTVSDYLFSTYVFYMYLLCIFKNIQPQSSLQSHKTVVDENILFSHYIILSKVNYCWFMVFNATFNNISVISWRSVLLVKESGVPGETHDLSLTNFKT